MAHLEVKVDTSDVYPLFAKVIERAENFSSVFLEAREYLQAAFAGNFAAGGLPSGGWAPLQPQTAAWKVAHGLPPVPLMPSALQASLTSLTGPVNVIGPKAAEFGTTVDYAKFHQYGAPRAHLPARRVVFEPPGFLSFLERAGVAHMEPGNSVANAIKGALP